MGFSVGLAKLMIEKLKHFTTMLPSFPYLLQDDLKLLKVSINEEEASNKDKDVNSSGSASVFGQILVDLSEVLPLRDASAQVERDIRRSVSDELVMHGACRLDGFIVLRLIVR